MRRIGGVALTVTGFLACPCHLILTLPLLISGLSGTAMGSFLKQNTGLIYTGAVIYFVVALAVGVFLLFGRTGSGTQEKMTCSICIPVDAPESEPWQSSPSEDLPVTRR
jgi:mercuric ion transport protein